MTGRLGKPYPEQDQIGVSMEPGLNPGWSLLDLNGNIEARWMVIIPIASGYRTRLTGLLGSLGLFMAYGIKSNAARLLGMTFAF